MSEWDDVLAAVAEGADVNARNKEDKTGLRQALVHSAPLRVVEAMVEAGGDLYAVDTNKSRALHLASSYKPPHWEEGLAVVKYLVSKGASPRATARATGLPIHSATVANNLPVLRYWIEDKNIDPGTRNTNGLTTLHKASDAGALDTAGYLVVVSQANPHARDIVSDRFVVVAVC